MNKGTAERRGLRRSRPGEVAEGCAPVAGRAAQRRRPDRRPLGKRCSKGNLEPAGKSGHQPRAAMGLEHTAKNVKDSSSETNNMKCSPVASHIILAKPLILQQVN